ncbi:hypothetical protein F5J12DRAFT_782301 [Pisolithus orientalis]|uniref:uncharacterized protein n=1 Tax=Pisolithus orientalis TaxID=936130 RepID=UPI0022248A85|nr:uncharacterized protein F5J12DRAFT_782301 [Pisolithus orientalis]KAI6008889.1 hypothetical protein F5J12DRAFT_782301 [Pisolithus orientalis]
MPKKFATYIDFCLERRLKERLKVEHHPFLRGGHCLYHLMHIGQQLINSRMQLHPCAQTVGEHAFWKAVIQFLSSQLAPDIGVMLGNVPPPSPPHAICITCTPIVKPLNAPHAVKGGDVSMLNGSNESPLSSVSVVENLKESTLAIYASTLNLSSHTKFFFGGTSSDVAILKSNSDDVTEMVLSGIFEIDHQGFFMAPKGSYNPKNAFSHKFLETKLICNLLTIQHDAMALEKLVPLKKGETLLSSQKDIKDDPKSIAHNEEATAVWPVPDDIKDVLTCAASTHNVSPLPAFDINGSPIKPVDYPQVHFAMLHFFIKGDRKSIFTTSLWELCMLWAPQHGPVNHFKHTFPEVI